MLKTFVLDTFADENKIKPLDFQLVARECRYTWMMHSWGGGDRSKQVIFSWVHTAPQCNKDCVNIA